MKKNLAFLLIVSLPLFASYNSYAWGKKGHGMVAEIAFSFLDSTTRQSVQKYLGNTTIEQASTWMDDMRSDHSYDYMKPWHYINIEKGMQYTPSKEDNLVNALNNAIATLEHREKLSDEEIKKNLMILFHLTGDLHMPLHIGYASDKGGNDVHVTFLGTQTNLHKLWDTDIIEHEGISVNDCLARLNRLDKNEMNMLREINVAEWINEPRSLLDKVYDFRDNTIDQAYATKNKPVIEDQLLIAGIRLAAVLDKAFKS